MKMQALRNGVKSLRSDVSTPCWVETGEAGRIGAAEGISGRVIFADFSSRTPGKIYRKNSDSPLLPPLIVFQINNFQAPWRNELASDSKILTHFLHNADNFTRILHIRFERFYD